MTFFQTANFGLLCALIGVTTYLLFQTLFMLKQTRFKFLALFFASNIIGQLDELVWLLELWKHNPWMVNLYIPFLYLMAPSFYYYIYNLTIQPAEPNYQKLIKLGLGFFVGFGLCLPYFLLDHNIKLEQLNAPEGSLQHLSYITYLPTIALILILPFSLIYLLMIYRLLSHILVGVKAYFSDIKNKDLSWVRWLILILIFAIIVSIFQLFLPQNITEIGIKKTTFILLEFFWIILFGHHALKQKQIQFKPVHIDPIQKPKYLKSKVGFEDGANIEEKLVKAMKNDQLHRNPTLTLNKLSSHIGVSENNISQVLNLTIKQNFYDFTNSWRIKDVCIMLENKDANLLQTIYEAGFNSRSTFNSAFKKHTGKTPSAYRAELK